MHPLDTEFKNAAANIPGFNMGMESLEAYYQIWIKTLSTSAETNWIIRYVDDPSDSSLPSKFGQAKSFIIISAEDASTYNLPEHFILMRQFKENTIKPLKVKLRNLKVSDAMDNTITVGHYFEKASGDYPSSVFESQIKVVPIGNILSPLYSVNDGIDRCYYYDSSLVMEYMNKEGQCVRLEKYLAGVIFNTDRAKFERYDDELPTMTHAYK